MSGWRWKLCRLMAMQPSEVAVRVWRAVRDRGIAAGALRPYPLNVDACTSSAWSHDPHAVYQRFLHRFPLSHYPHTTWRMFVQDEYPQCAEAILREAERVLAGRMRLFTFEVHTDIPPNWFRNTVQGGEWPALPAREVDYRRGDIAGGVRYCWELNRHGYFLTLAQAWFLSADERYAQRLMQDWLDWIERNPPRFGVNWTSMLECALRVHTWTWSLWFLCDCPFLDHTALQHILGSLWQQCAEVAMNLSVGSSANNHIIGEAAGLWLFANLFPTARHAERWRQIARRILEREIPRQITPDGVSVEQALHYQVFVMELALHADMLARHVGEPFGERYAQRLQAAAQFLRAVTDRAGNTQHIGDSDDAEVLPLCPNGSHPELEMVDAVDALYVGTKPQTLKVAWLTAQPLRAQTSAPSDTSYPSADPPTSRLFAEGGYAVMRDREGKRLAVMDCGALGWGSIAAHGHADALSVTLSVDGQPILVDAGTYCYHDEPLWRNAFRTTRYHNTVCVDDTNQSEMLGAFLWGARAQVRIIRWHSADLCDMLCAAHDGYRRLGCGEHLRWLFWLKPDLWLVVDHVEQSEGHSVVQNWLFSQDCAVQVAGATMGVRCGEVALRVLCASDVEIQWVQGGAPEEGGWISPSFGRKEPAPLVSVHATRGTGYLATLFALEGQPVERIHLRSLPDGWEVQVGGDENWLIGVSRETRRWEALAIPIEAKAFIARWRNGEVQYEIID